MRYVILVLVFAGTFLLTLRVYDDGDNGRFRASTWALQAVFMTVLTLIVFYIHRNPGVI
jgi:hypothetical protein